MGSSPLYVEALSLYSPTVEALDFTSTITE